MKATLLIITPKNGSWDRRHIKVGDEIIENMMVLGIAPDESYQGLVILGQRNMKSIEFDIERDD